MRKRKAGTSEQARGLWDHNVSLLSLYGLLLLLPCCKESASSTQQSGDASQHFAPVRNIVGLLPYSQGILDEEGLVG